MNFNRNLVGVLLAGMIGLGSAAGALAGDRITLADFSQYPQGWEAKGGWERAHAIYELAREGDAAFLRAGPAEDSVRIFKKIAWDSKEYPVIEWQWRVKKWPQDAPAQIYLYISLDRDLLGIPVITKYIWSRDAEVGQVRGGGFFRATEIVIRGGADSSQDWVTERVDATGDFIEMAGHEPKGTAYGVGFLVDPGVEVEIRSISAVRKQE